VRVRASLTCSAILAVASLAASCLVAAGASGAGTTVLYLDLGASVSRGVQPTPAVPSGQPTRRGYANRLVTMERARGVTLVLTELGCPGESIATMLHGPDPCYLAPDTQLSDAVAFLRTHHSATTLVTIDMGFNTLDVCFRHLDIDPTCVTPVLKTLRSQLGSLVSILTHAAGPRVSFVGLNHYNPYLTKGTAEGAQEAFALNSVSAISRMNLVFAQVYLAHHIPVADVEGAFHEDDTHAVAVAGQKEKVPVNVTFECRFTWMCKPRPYGPNIHPTDAGYAAIARAISLVLPSRW
jgi:hypothetical protein